MKTLVVSRVFHIFFEEEIFAEFYVFHIKGVFRYPS